MVDFKYKIHWLKNSELKEIKSLHAEYPKEPWNGIGSLGIVG